MLSTEGRAWPVHALAGAVAAVAMATGCGGGSEEAVDSGRDRPVQTAGGVDGGSAGTGSESAPSPAHHVTGTPEHGVLARYLVFADYIEIGSAAGACDELTRAFWRRLGGGRQACERRVTRMLADDRVVTGEREIVSVEMVDDRHAVARVRTPTGTRRLRFAFDEGRWRIDAGNPWR